jgi:NAD(P)-dependent dehydrogenase (short-subunit alcohol dehydrogenase family)
VVREIVPAGGLAVAVQGDVGRETDLLRLFETAEKELGAIGEQRGCDGRFRSRGIHVLAMNVTGMMLCSREAFPLSAP